MRARNWAIWIGAAAGVGLLVYLARRETKKFVASVDASQAATNAAVDNSGLTDQASASYSAGAQMYVPMVLAGQLTGQSTLWTATDEQSKLVGPRFPSYYDGDNQYFVFDNASGTGYTHITLDSNGRVTGSGVSTDKAAA